LAMRPCETLGPMPKKLSRERWRCQVFEKECGLAGSHTFTSVASVKLKPLRNTWNVNTMSDVNTSSTYHRAAHSTTVTLSLVGRNSNCSNDAARQRGRETSGRFSVPLALVRRCGQSFEETPRFRTAPAPPTSTGANSCTIKPDCTPQLL
jgi:hypothetical protein